ncbi:MAG: FAA hydrolase family protein [Alphaproteobacteria bacterium]|nr:MAG: FAA hydrolase family protein [Alphaproteobacteria bacterium]
MKLVRFGERDAEKPGLIDAGGAIRDLSGHISDISADSFTSDFYDRLAAIDPASLPHAPDGVRLGSPIRRPGHFIAIGLNFADHAIEAGLEVPAEPVIFSKAPSSVCGPNDDIKLPRGSQKGDWEVELALVIGKRASYVSEAEALSHVFGYLLCNDVSERAFQLEGTGQWIKGKSAETFGPLGPWLVTADEIGDQQDLDMWLDLNGQRMQTGNTKTMIFSVAHLIAYLSEKMVLEPGDVVTTGTPPGVGMGRKPPLYLKAGDTMRLGVTGLGEQRQTVVSA